MTLAKTLVLLLSLTLVSTACSKKKSAKGKGAAATPAKPTLPEQQSLDVGDGEDDREIGGNGRQRPRPGGRLQQDDLDIPAEGDGEGDERDGDVGGSQRRANEERLQDSRFAQAEEYKRRNPAPNRETPPALGEGDEYERGGGERDDSQYNEDDGSQYSRGNGGRQSMNLNPANGGTEQDECGAAYRRDTKDLFYPGLPFKASKHRYCTFGSVGEVSEQELQSCQFAPQDKDNHSDKPGFLYTDSRPDDLMGHAVKQAASVPAHLDEVSRRTFAKRIRGVVLRQYQGSIEAEVVVFFGRKKYETFVMRGGMGRSRHDIQLSTATVNNVSMNGMVTCADVDGSCNSAIVRLQQLNKNGKITRIAYVVYRSGNAHVTMADEDRLQPHTIRNQAHAQFAELLSNTAYKSCAINLREHYAGRLPLQPCAVNRLKQICGGGGQLREPSAKQFNLRSWAVAFGRAGFEFTIDDQLSVRGPLVIAAQAPMWKPNACVEGKPKNGACGLRVSGRLAQGIDNALLVMNDGGGNLNLQFDFVGKAQTRISVTSILEDTAVSSQTSLARAQKMPGIRAGDYIDQRDMEQNGSERDGQQPQAQQRQTAPQVQARVAPQAKAQVQKPQAKQAQAKAKPQTAKQAKAAAAKKAANGKKGADGKAVDPKAAQQKATDAKTPEVKAGETKPAETKTDEKASETKAEETKADDKAAAPAVNPPAQAETTTQEQTLPEVTKEEKSQQQAPVKPQAKVQDRIQSQAGTQSAVVKKQIDKESPVRVPPAGRQVAQPKTSAPALNDTDGDDEG